MAAIKCKDLQLAQHKTLDFPVLWVRNEQGVYVVRFPQGDNGPATTLQLTVDEFMQQYKVLER